MTPERKEEIEGILEAFGKLPKHMALELLAALEEEQQANTKCKSLILTIKKDNELLEESLSEAQQRIADKTAKMDEILRELFAKTVEFNRIKGDLAEAQQTIARQQKVIDWYESGGSMGELLEEGKVQP